MNSFGDVSTSGGFAQYATEDIGLSSAVSNIGAQTYNTTRMIGLGIVAIAVIVVAVVLVKVIKGKKK